MRKGLWPRFKRTIPRFLLSNGTTIASFGVRLCRVISTHNAYSAIQDKKMTRLALLRFWVLIASTSLLLMTLFMQARGVATSEAVELQSEDCVKCHLLQPTILDKAGGGHLMPSGCLVCHPQHLPSGEVTVTACNDCHSGQEHFEIDTCLHCHADPHQPLASLREARKPVRRECLSCHSDVVVQMDASPSRHAQLSCNSCHEKHQQRPVCLDCHVSHLNGQLSSDCLRCHGAHDPLKITPTGFIPGRFCYPCHRKQADDLAETQSNHGGLNCAYCHAGPHTSTPGCLDCHGLPHAQPIHGQYRQCLECHGDAHLLISQ